MNYKKEVIEEAVRMIRTLVDYGVNPSIDTIAEKLDYPAPFQERLNHAKIAYKIAFFEQLNVKELLILLPMYDEIRTRCTVVPGDYFVKTDGVLDKRGKQLLIEQLETLPQLRDDNGRCSV